MKKILGLILAFFCFFEIFAGDGLVFRDSPFEISAKTDGALLSAGVLLSGGDLILDNLLKVNRKTFDEDKNFDKSSVNAFDRFFMQDYNAGLDKIGQHVVFVGSANQFPNRQAHLFGVVSCQDISKIPGGHADIDWVAQRDLLIAHQVAVGADVIDDLRQQPSPVNGVGRRKAIAIFC